MSTSYLTSGSMAVSRHASCVGWKGRPKWPHFPPSHPTNSCLWSPPGVSVPQPIQHFVNSMQACNQKGDPSIQKTRPPCTNHGPCRVKYAILLCGDVSRRPARDLPCNPQLAPAAHGFSHDVHMLPDLGKHGYVPPCFMHRMEESPKVAPFPSLTPIHPTRAF